MRPACPLLVLALLAAAPSGAAVEPAPQVAASLIAALSESPAAAPADALAVAAFPDLPTVRRWRERVDRVRVESRRAEVVARDEASLVVRVELSAHGVSRTPAAARLALPAVWWVTATTSGSGPPSLATVETAAERAAGLLLAAAPEDREGALAAAAADGAGPEEVAEALSRHPLTAGQRPAAAAVASWLVARAAARDDAGCELYAQLLLARLALAEGDRAEARSLVEDWLGRHRATASADLVAQARIGIARSVRGDPDVWRLPLAEVIDAAPRLQHADLLLDALSLLASLQVENFELDAAQHTLGRLDELADRFGWLRGKLESAAIAGFRYRLLHLDGESQAQYERALTLATLAGDRTAMAQSMFWLARNEVRSEATARQGVERLKAALAVVPDRDHDTRVYLVAELARRLIDVGELERAGQVSEALVPMIPDAEPFWTRRDAWLAVGRVRQAHARWEEAAAAFRHSLQEGGDLVLWQNWVTKTYLAGALRKLGRRDEAAAELLEAVELIEARRVLVPTSVEGGVRYFADKVAPYRDLATLLVEMGRAEEALAMTERARARVLREVLAEGAPSATLEPADQQQLQALHRRVVELDRSALDPPRRESRGRELAEAREALARFGADLAIRRPESALRGGSGPLPPLDASPYPAAGTAVVEFLLHGDASIAFVVRRGADGNLVVRAARLAIAPADLGREAAAFSRSVAARNLRYAEHGRRLYAALWEPLAAQLAGTPTVAIVPDGPLWTVPFHALPGPEGQPLLTRHRISYLHSLEVAQRLAALAPGGDEALPELLVFADPVAAGNGRAPADRLPAAAAEARAIAALYQDAGLFVGDAARESIAKEVLGGYEVLHFATHGEIDHDAPLHSALLLGGDEREDGRLEAHEVAALRLRAQLAVLSACDTARGEVTNGEGLLGMAWAFQLAGVPRVVVSQWQAESQAAARLMVDFHRALLGGDGPAEALRRAQLSLQRHPRYRHPFYWAPFVVIGDGN